jgi:uncharacterized SAM-binding protein YcdF (DUF218 family)
MFGYLYSLLLKLLYPTSVALVFLMAALAVKRWRRIAVALAAAALLVGGNGWVVHAMMRGLEWQYLPPEPVPNADAILILSGGILSRTPPRTTIEVGDPGDRVLYGGELFREGRAPLVICTGHTGTGGIAARPQAEDMADLLVTVGVPRDAIMLEKKAQNTYQHAVNLCPVFEQRGIRRVLLVTSALHMPRSLGVFRRSCPSVDYVPAPTDFRATYDEPTVWYREMTHLWPTPRTLMDFSDAAHEYVGMLYYSVRGWM